jgi:HJR/Mrr/RecB family endonuclease
MQPILEYLADHNFNNARIIQKSSHGGYSLRDYLQEAYNRSDDLQQNWHLYFFRLKSSVKDYRHFIITHVNKAWETYYLASGMIDKYNEALSQSESLKECNNVLASIFIDSIKQKECQFSKTLCFIADLTDDLPIGLLKDVVNEILVQSELLRVKKFIILEDKHSVRYGRNTKEILNNFYPDVVYSEVFEVQHKTIADSHIKIYHFIEMELIQHLKNDPHKLYALTPRQFEELVASIFKNQGFDVELTPKTRDGGIDIIAVQKSLYTGDSVHLIECKRYAPHNTVGIGIVQRVLGAVAQHEASKGIVITTSHFTNDAKKVAIDTKQQLTLCDYNDLLIWLNSLNI